MRDVTSGMAQRIREILWLPFVVDGDVVIVVPETWARSSSSTQLEAKVELFQSRHAFAN